MADKEFAWLATLGYTGSLADKRNAYYNDLITNGGEPDIPIVAEYAPSRELWTSSSVIIATQRVVLTYFTARVTETITTVTAYTAGTAAGATPTVCRYGIYSVDSNDDLTLVASTANDTALFASTNTAYPKALSSSWSKVAGRRYAAGVLVVTAAATPVFMGHAGVSATVVSTRYADKPRLCSFLGSQSDLPSSILNSAVSVTNGRIAFYMNG